MINQGSQTKGKGVAEKALATLPTMLLTFLEIEVVSFVESWWKGSILRHFDQHNKYKNAWKGTEWLSTILYKSVRT